MADPVAAGTTPATPASAGMRAHIAAKWSKFTPQDVAALKSTDELVAQVQSKYQLDKTQAQKDVDAFANGRPL